MAKKKAKRYTDAQKKEILDFIEGRGRGGQTEAVRKFKVTAATIASWKRKAEGGGAKASRKVGGSKEIKTLQELSSILTQISALEEKLNSLRRKYKKLKAKL